MTLQPVEQALEEVAAVLDQAWRDCESTWETFALVDAWRDVNYALSNIRRAHREPVIYRRASLTARDVRAMRQRRTAGESLRRLATRYGVSVTTVSKIVNGESWKEVA